MTLETLRTLNEFLESRPGLTLTFWSEDDTTRILAMRASGEFASARFLHRTKADMDEGELTRALNEIALALEEHDRQYPIDLPRKYATI